MTWLDSLLSEAQAEMPTGLPPELGLTACGNELANHPFDATLEAFCAGLPPQDALDLREERAAILEHDAVLPRAEAERRAGLWAPSQI